MPMPRSWNCSAASGKLYDRMIQMESSSPSRISQIDPNQQSSARNLLHYLAVRREDLRPLQEALTRHGLSSLGRCEAHVMSSLQAVIRVLAQLVDEQPQSARMQQPPVDFESGPKLIAQRTRQLFGTAHHDRGVHIMVTMPYAAAESYEFVGDLVAHGMDCMRINCAHDDPNTWRKMIAHLRRAEQEYGRSCRVFMDLGGPKLRTGPLAMKQPYLHWKPKKDRLGRVLLPARIWLTSDQHPSPPPIPSDVTVQVKGVWLEGIQAQDEIRFLDARGRKRMLRVARVTNSGVWAECDRSTYLTIATRLKLYRDGQRKHGYPKGRIGWIPPTESHISLRQGDRLMLCDSEHLGEPASYDDYGQLIQHAHIGCTLPDIFGDLGKGQRVLFDDGKITGRIEETYPHQTLIEITASKRDGSKLRADKGINLPDSDLHLQALTDKDIQDLAFIVEHADMVGYSFVRRPADVHQLQAELKRLGHETMPIVLKVENRQAFANLPQLLLATMQSPLVGVMIARGDLAVECGWQRLAEVQEEILWMCEAAHIPVIWATQVLEGLAKEGIPTRAEITDAAMSVRAECVMLNKGPHILKALHVLDDILMRMQDHQAKKRPLLRRLSVAEGI